MGIKVSPALQRQLIENGIVGPTTVIHHETIPKEVFAFAVGAGLPGFKFVVTIHLTLPSMANLRLHWAAKAKIVKKQRKAVADALCGLQAPQLPVNVTLTRIAPRFIRDKDDNLPSAFKHVKDQVAAWFECDDASDQYMWKYAQEKGKVSMVRIEIKGAP